MNAVDIPSTMAQMGAAARAASSVLAASTTAARNQALLALAGRLRQHSAELVAANALDLAAASAAGLDAPLQDRLKLTPAIIATVAEGDRKSVV